MNILRATLAISWTIADGNISLAMTKSRGPLTRCAVWLSIKLYQLGDGALGGGNNGMRSWKLT